jgi:hypothetical protein
MDLSPSGANPNPKPEAWPNREVIASLFLNAHG